MRIALASIETATEKSILYAIFLSVLIENICIYRHVAPDTFSLQRANIFRSIFIDFILFSLFVEIHWKIKSIKHDGNLFSLFLSLISCYSLISLISLNEYRARAYT